MAKRKVDVILKAHDQASKAFRSAGKSAGGLFKSFTKAFGGIQQLIAGVAVVAFAKKSIAAFGEQEKAARLLDDALATVGNTSALEAKRLEAFAASIQQVTEFGDETIMGLQALAIQMTGQTGPTIDRMTKSAIGMSRALGIDARAAMLLLAKAQKGEMSSLSRYGIILDETMTKQEKFNEVLKIGERQFNTYTKEGLDFGGQMEQIWNSLGDTAEIVGGKIARAFSEGADGSKSLLENIEDTITAINELMILEEKNANILNKYNQEADKEPGWLKKGWRGWTGWWQEVGDRWKGSSLPDLNATTTLFNDLLAESHAEYQKGLITLDEYIARKEKLAAEFDITGVSFRPSEYESPPEMAARELKAQAKAEAQAAAEEAERKANVEAAIQEGQAAAEEAMKKRLEAEAEAALKELELREEAKERKLEMERELAEEIEKLRIETTLEGHDQELELLAIKHRKELEAARQQGIDLDLVRQKQSLERQKLGQTAREPFGSGYTPLAALESRFLHDTTRQDSMPEQLRNLNEQTRQGVEYARTQAELLRQLKKNSDEELAQMQTDDQTVEL